MVAALTPTFGIVEAPPAEPPIVGLIANLPRAYLVDDDAEMLDGHPVRWAGGLSYAPEQICITTGAEDPCDQVTVLTIPPNPSIVSVMPFIVWAGDQCSTFGWHDRDYVGRATRALLASESAAISFEFWTGTRAKVAGWPNNYLAGPFANVLSTGSSGVTPGEALACLEQGIAETSNGQRGMIHCTPQLGAAFSELGNTVRNIDNVILTYRGTIINPDAGNPGTGPTGQPLTSDHQWAYGTLLPTVRRSPISVWPGSLAEATNRDTNFIAYRAERLAAVSFPPCTHVAVQVALPICGGGS